MTELYSGITAGGILLFCFGLYKLANGKLKEKVSRHECHSAQKAIGKRIEDLSGHIDTRIDDLKDFIRNGGK